MSASKKTISRFSSGTQVVSLKDLNIAVIFPDRDDVYNSRVTDIRLCQMSLSIRLFKLAAKAYRFFVLAMVTDLCPNLGCVKWDILMTHGVSGSWAERLRLQRQRTQLRIDRLPRELQIQILSYLDSVDSLRNVIRASSSMAAVYDSNEKVIFLDQQSPRSSCS